MSDPIQKEFCYTPDCVFHGHKVAYNVSALYVKNGLTNIKVERESWNIHGRRVLLCEHCSKVEREKWKK